MTKMKSNIDWSNVVEIMFFELLGQSKLNGIKLTIDGKEPYRRLLIRLVYPAIKNQPTVNERKSK